MSITSCILTIILIPLAKLNNVHAFSSSTPPPPEVKKVIQNLLSISTHLQNPDLYSTSWANRVTVTLSNSVIASKHVKKGELLTLYPVNAIGIKKSKMSERDDSNKQSPYSSSSSTEIKFSGMSKKKNTKKKSKKLLIEENKDKFLESYDYLYHDSKWNFDVTLPNMKAYQHEVELLIPSTTSILPSNLFGVHSLLAQYQDKLFIQSHPDRRVLPGWYGHLIPTKENLSITSKSMNRQKVDAHNCLLVPIPCSLPLCGIVATRDIEKGEKIIRQVFNGHCEEEEEESMTVDLVQWVVRRYTSEVSELSSYYQMAYTVNEEKQMTLDGNNNDSIPSSSFHPINDSYPNIIKLHSNPDVYKISQFLTSDECDRLIQKSSSNLTPCLIKSEESGVVQMDPTIRTSSNANIPQNEVPSITEKIKRLTNCSEKQLEIYQVLKYEKGQEFKPHTDGFEGPITACGFFQSGRIATLFTYLNDVEDGGKTIFNKIGLEIKPEKGTAIVHFPMTLDLIEDKRTEHEGSMAVDEKWIMTTWIWRDERLDERYAEERLEILSEDII